MPTVAGKEPFAGFSSQPTPVLAQLFKQLGAEHDVAVLCAGKSYVLWTQTESTEASLWE